MQTTMDKKAFKKAIESDRAFQTFLEQCKPLTNDKDFSSSLILQVVDVLKDKKESGTHKFYALRVYNKNNNKLLCDCVQTYKSMIVNSVANAKELHELIKGYAQFSKETDDDDRGALIFGKKDERIIGIEFLRLVLESIMTWGKKYPFDAKGNPTRFSNLYSELKDQGVKFPSKFQFFPQPVQDQALAQTAAPVQADKVKPKPMVQTQMQQQIQPLKKAPEPKELKARYFKMFASTMDDAENLEATLKEADEPEDFIQEILAQVNTTFSTQLNMLEKLIQESLQLENVFSEGESAKMFQLKEFFRTYTEQFKIMEQTGFLDTAYKTFKFLLLQQVAELQGKEPSSTPPLKQSYNLQDQYKSSAKEEDKAPPRDENTLPPQMAQSKMNDSKMTESLYKSSNTQNFQRQTSYNVGQDSINPGNSTYNNPQVDTNQQSFKQTSQQNQQTQNASQYQSKAPTQNEQQKTIESQYQLKETDNKLKSTYNMRQDSFNPAISTYNNPKVDTIQQSFQQKSQQNNQTPIVSQYQSKAPIQNEQYKIIESQYQPKETDNKLKSTYNPGVDTNQSSFQQTSQQNYQNSNASQYQSKVPTQNEQQKIIESQYQPKETDNKLKSTYNPRVDTNQQSFKQTSQQNYQTPNASQYQNKSTTLNEQQKTIESQYKPQETNNYLQSTQYMGQDNEDPYSPPKFYQSKHLKSTLQETSQGKFSQQTQIQNPMVNTQISQQMNNTQFTQNKSSPMANSILRQTSPNQASPYRQQNKLIKSGIDEFSERFDALSMSTMSVRDFPQKNQQMTDEKSYKGYLVPYDGRQFELFTQLGLSDNQVRRLKVACVKQKASIFESTQIQIGIISKLILHEMTDRYFLKLSVVFGNKTKAPMFNCQINYEGDYGISLWTQDLYLDTKEGIPKRNDGEIDLAAKQQLYQSIVIHYNTIPFNSINGNLSWQDDQNQLKASFVLPCLIPKFMKFLETDQLVFKQKWHYKNHQCLKSEIIQFNPKIIRQPIFFKRYFPEMIEISSLIDYLNLKQDQNGNFRDFKLGGTFCLQSPKIEFMLKIIVRPNLTGIFKIIPYQSYHNQAEQILHNLVFLFGLPS